MFLSVFFVLEVLLPCAAWGQGQPQILVKEIAVEGNRRVQEAVILGRIQTKVGSPFLPARLGEDIRSVFALAFFDDVRLKVEDFEGGVKVTFIVVERPFIRDVDFTGNKRVDTKTLQEKIDLKLGSVYNPVDVQRALEKLKDHYEEEGYFEVQITPDAEKLPDGDVKVVFRITEGRRITIDRIVIEGAKGLSEKRVKGVMQTQERQYFVLRGILHRQRLEQDVELITQLYNDHGYIQARVESTDIQVDRARARVTIKIVVVEGPQFFVGSVDVTGPTVLPVEEVRRQIVLKPGEAYSRSRVRDTVNRITALYHAIGRASAEVTPLLGQDTAARKVNLTIEIKEGPEVFVERINISGNVRSAEKILRREIPMAEGDLFTSQKLERARQRLVNLGYFETVKATTAPGATKDKIIVTIEVTERPTGLFSLGGGYSSVDGFLGTLDLSQRNFLGRGWELFLRIRGGATTQQGTVGFTEPWLFDRPLSAGFDIFNNRRIFTDFTVESLGGDIRFSHPFFDFARWHLNYRLTQDKITDVAETASDTLKREEGTTLTSLVEGALTRDTRDNVFAPMTGSRASLVLDVAGLGGESKFMKIVGDLAYFQPVFRGTILAGRVEGGYGFGFGEDELPLFERFFLGGPNSIRSRKFRQISPVDSSGARIGGTSEALLNLEYIVPVVYGIRVATFFDVGNVYGLTKDFDLTDTREAAGLGVRWQSPFGPIRLDWGYNLDRRKGESPSQFHFSVGSPF
ncbi:MAG: outer membrane protein assembly factor BamA [Candidatus Rokubacteria bacterium]|nr:outer membrane protein assembly factor BamA [Candidatus Rokubacteria bacterium]